MENSPKYFDPRTLAKLEGLELRARQIVEGYVSGVHRSPYHGFSVEFAEHREYVPGDDTRHVDWKVWGKTDKYYLKQFEQETNLICYLVLDTSESMRYRSDAAGLSKLEYAQCIAAALASLVLNQQDSVGLVTFNDEIRSFVRPAGSPAHLKELLHAMEQSAAEKKTATGRILHELAERFKKRGLVVVLSDLLDDVAEILAGLRHLRHCRHDVIIMHTLDAAELDFPFRNTMLFKGLEQLPEVVADPRSLRKAYLAELSHFTRALRDGCRSQSIDYLLLRTDQPLDVALSAYLSQRTIRMK